MIELDQVPDLVDPVLVAAFEGWNDAADAASAVLDHLAGVWDPVGLATLDPEEFYDFQVNRPEIETGDNDVRRITWPTTRISYVRPPGAARDLVLLRGIEPNMRWRQFCTEILAVADDLDVQMVVTLGALLADVPHTRPIPISGTTFDEDLRGQLGLEESLYEGPTGIIGVLGDFCRRRSLPAVSLWAAVPHYVAQPPCPKATLALLRRLEDLLEIGVPLGSLPEDSKSWERGVEDLAASDDEVARYVRALEEQRDATDLPEASGDAIAKEFERYLRQRGEGDMGA